MGWRSACCLDRSLTRPTKSRSCRFVIANHSSGPRSRFRRTAGSALLLERCSRRSSSTSSHDRTADGLTLFGGRSLCGRSRYERRALAASSHRSVRCDGHSLEDVNELVDDLIYGEVELAFSPSQCDLVDGAREGV